jgi:crossover junction endodeoxyribonuclease RuvC
MRIGIDVGNTGALALLNDKSNVVALVDMPIMALGKNKHQVNAVELARTIERWTTTFTTPYLPITVFVEDVHTMPNQGVASSGNFMFGKGVIVGVVATLRLPMILVTPQSWKKRAGLIGKDKDYARTLAQQLYPTADLGRKKDIGRADALLIARYGLKES